MTDVISFWETKLEELGYDATYNTITNEFVVYPYLTYKLGRAIDMNDHKLSILTVDIWDQNESSIKLVSEIGEALEELVNWEVFSSAKHFFTVVPIDNDIIPDPEKDIKRNQYLFRLKIWKS